jgi:Zn-dependent protease with chaperone function
MSQHAELANEFCRAFLFSLLAFFLVPAIGYVFIWHVQDRLDAKTAEDELGSRQAIIWMSQGRAWLTKEQESEYSRFYQGVPASAACGDRGVELREYRLKVCARFSQNWQFYVAGLVAWWTLVGGVGVFAGIAALGALAFADRSARFLSFVVGWRVLSIVSAVEVVAQGALVAWLSYWMPAYFFNIHSLKLAVICGLVIAVGAFSAVAWIFGRPQRFNVVEGTLLSREEEPVLWSRVRDMAARLDTAPPDHIIAGIDSSFFVAEAPLSLGGQEVRGRSLFISLPLLRVLDTREADAMLAHELAHFRGGDTAMLAKLGPHLMWFDYYYAVLQQSSAAFVSPILRLYRLVFELALGRDSRSRELLADRTAAAYVSSEALVHGLIKVAAYASYRRRIEQWLFEQKQRHAGTLGIGGKVATGLLSYVESPQFAEDMREVTLPHPFDSHPLLQERMRNIGLEVSERRYAEIARMTPSSSWVDEIGSADAVEAGLWAAYEQHFVSEHEKSLAYRYLPANEEEEAVVTKYFPPVVFQTKHGKKIEISYSGVSITRGGDINSSKRLSWDDIVGIGYKKSRLRGDRLILVNPRRGLWIFNRTTVRLRGIGDDAERLQTALVQYAHRHHVMRQLSAASEEGEGTLELESAPAPY